MNNIAKQFLKICIVIFLVVSIAVCIFINLMFNMPGENYSGNLRALTPHDLQIQSYLKEVVVTLSDEIGIRSVEINRTNVWTSKELKLLREHREENLNKAADYIESEFQSAGFIPTRQEYIVDATPCYNIVVEQKGRIKPDEIIVVGAHYDSVEHTYGANDNATGVAAILAFAHAFHEKPHEKTLRLVAFTNEEPPFFQKETMGSYVYAKSCKENGDNIVGMISLDMLGYYSNEAGSQMYPFPFNLLYSTTGNYIAFVSNISSRNLLYQSVQSFRENAEFPSMGGAAPEWIREIGMSDNWSFWQMGYPAIMVTDTGPNRYPHYHSIQDKPDKIKFDEMTHVVKGLGNVIADLIGYSGDLWLNFSTNDITD